MQRSTSFVSIKLATLTAALALCGAAYAAPDTAATPAATTQASASAAAPAATERPAAHPHKRGDHRKGMRGHMRDAAMWVPGYGPLHAKFVESLALNDNQAKLLKDAQAEQKEARSARRDAMKTARTAKLEQVKSGKIDPRAALTQSEQAYKQLAAERSKLDEKWLAVWDALDASQQEKVAANLNERAEKFAKRAEKHKQHHASPDAAKLAS
ncbi:hypothetical protein [Pollutimonas bauzanensis]|uniref:LTXXQ motif family protein n=1 Tax=Pollutimonas bauzanensis TaxID=658167 RepID=A0A1M5ZAF8_9BURK|nr:hypothetical protein [Pollutimonas bauzanensis]SHI21215.1 hypothetical protein SAMN04488135_11393 [Pollutimonas bauzanensis]